MSQEPSDFDIIEAALTGWDSPEPSEIPPARAALERVKKIYFRYISALLELKRNSTLYEHQSKIINRAFEID